MTAKNGNRKAGKKNAVARIIKRIDIKDVGKMTVLTALNLGGLYLVGRSNFFAKLLAALVVTTASEEVFEKTKKLVARKKSSVVIVKEA